MFPNSQLVIKDIKLKTDTNIFSDFIDIIRVFHVHELYLPWFWFQDSCQQINSGWLPSTIMAQEAEDLIRVKIDWNFGNYFLIIIGFHNIAHWHHWPFITINFLFISCWGFCLWFNIQAFLNQRLPILRNSTVSVSETIKEEERMTIWSILIWHDIIQINGKHKKDHYAYQKWCYSIRITVI